MIPIITRSTNASIKAEEGRTLSGYAIKWNDPSRLIRENGRAFTETIQRSAFDISGKGFDDIKLFFQHNNEMPLARTNNGSLTLRNEPEGLHFEAILPDTTLGNDIRVLLENGTLEGSMSFGFSADQVVWSKDGKERSIHSGKLYEVSIVVDPAYKNTSSELRSEAGMDTVVPAQEINTKRISLIRQTRNL